MRIIAGKFKGRIVKFPNSKLVRPTTDKVKESLFNYLVHTIDFSGIKVCDLYAGSGSLGLEALSRGAKEIHFVEKEFNVVKVLKGIIVSLNAEDECTVFKMDSLRFTKLIKHDAYNLILADPPFFKDDIHSVVQNIISKDFLIKDGVMLIERSIQTLKKDVESFNREPFKRLGDSVIYQFISN